MSSNQRYTALMPFLIEDIPFLPVGARESLIRVISPLLSHQEDCLTLLGAIEMAEKNPLSAGALPARECRRFLESLGQLTKEQNFRTRSFVKVSRLAWDTISSTIKEEDHNLLIYPWSSALSNNDFPGALINEVLEKSPIDTLVVKHGKRRDIKNILIVLNNNAYFKLVMDVALAIVEKFNSDLTIMHTHDKDISNEESQRKNAVLCSHLAGRGLGDGAYRIITGNLNDITGSVDGIATGYDLIITEATHFTSKGKGQTGAFVDLFEDNMNASVIIAKPAIRMESKFCSLKKVTDRGNGRPKTMSTTDIVDKWFAENSFHAAEFSDIGRLVELKQKQGLKISLALPTLNEEETIGNIINTIKNDLCNRYPLLDEIVVIDSRSEDNTVETARSYGIEVFDESEILPEWGSRAGKGGALWKSLYILRGDIIVWIDTDIKNIHPRFVYGLVGPLIKHPELKYVKGFYRRPVKIDGHYFETGGGRVTELTARPLLNLFFPELSGLVQPLSGEYAGRREVLEQVGFYNGYGVEIGLLIDILDKFGLNAIGQVDLIERIHRNQSLASLSKMSSAIIQVVIDKLEKRHRIRLMDEVNKIMKLVKHDPNQFFLESKIIEETMNPPMVTLAEYRELFGDYVDLASELL